MILWFVYLSHVGPSIALFPYISVLGDTYGLVWSGAIAFFYIGAILLSDKIRPDILHVTLPPWVVTTALIIISAISIAYIVKIFGFNRSLPSLADVYGVRSNFKSDLAASGSSLVGYFIIIGGYALAPLLLLMAIRNIRSRTLVSFMMIGLSISLSFTIYAAGGFKSIVFAPLLFLCCYFIFSRVRNPVLAVALGLPLFVVLTFGVSVLNANSEFLFYQVARRVFFVPAMDVTYFYEYVNRFGLDTLESAPATIAMYYYGTDGSANAGLFGDGFAKFGYIGVALNTLLFSSMLILADYCSRGIPPKVSFSIFIISAYAIANSSLTTVLLSYGFVVVCMTLAVSRRALGLPDNGQEDRLNC